MMTKLVEGEDALRDKEKDEKNPYEYLFGEFEFRTYNSKLP
jgi:hypothetical protein